MNDDYRMIRGTVDLDLSMCTRQYTWTPLGVLSERGVASLFLCRQPWGCGSG